MTRPARLAVILVTFGVFCVMLAGPAWAWRGGFGGFHGGFGGVSGFHAGGFGGGFGSVHYGGWSHLGPTGFTHFGGATHVGWGGGVEHYGGFSHAGLDGAQHYGGWGAYHPATGAWGGYHAAYTERPLNYGSLTHYDTAYHTPGTYGGWGHAFVGPAGYGAAAVHGPLGGTAAAYRGPFTSGAAVRGPLGYGAGAVRGPAGGVVAGYRGPYSSGAVAALPSGYRATAWRGTTYYHSGFAFYQPYWYAGTVSYMPVLPPLGWFFDTLPPGATQTFVNNNTYYVSDGVYYQPSTQNGQQGYSVVEAPAGATQSPPPPAHTDVDPFPMLKKMSDYVGQEKRIVTTISEDFDEVALAGQKIQLSNQRTIYLERPDELSAQVHGSGVDRRLVYDGREFTTLDLTKNVYATIPMKGPLDSVLDKLATEYGIAQPADDLLYSDIYKRFAPKIQLGRYLGPDTIADVKCDHLAFTQADANWEIWIEQSDRPVPRKLVITYEKEPGRPQYTLLITKWETPAAIPDSEFKIDLPANAASASVLSLTGQAAPAQ
jgi:hypothetical protein